MKKSDFYYDLPQELIAQTPAEPRDSSRLLAYDVKSGRTEHKRFNDITGYLKAGDVLVVNNTRVINARLDGVKKGSGGKMEFLLLKRLDLKRWEVMVKPGKKAGIGTEFVFGKNGELSAKIEAKTDSGGRIAEFSYEGVFEDVLRCIGQTPLPHYIKRGASLERYNTVYSKVDGSSAAPTAGLHFTPALLEKIKSMGVEVIEVLLHVGLGTFRPVKAENVEEHKMHSEYCFIGAAEAALINKAKAQGRRVIAVGTTSVRTLESAAVKQGDSIQGDGVLCPAGPLCDISTPPCAACVRPGAMDTDIFIYPPYKFRIADALITNFHLPESTLLMLLAAFIGDKGKKDGVKAVQDVYKEAVKERYRFFSFGDSCFFH